MGKETHIRRVPPCPAYDLEAMESWLMDMAREGWHLEDQGISCGLANFQRGEPREDQYRLVGFWKPPTMGHVLGVKLSTQYLSDQPEEEALDLNRLYGWEYVAKRGKYFIYRAVEAAPRELDTDPMIQSMTIRAAAQWDGLRLLWFVPFVLRMLRPGGAYSFLDLLASAPLLYVGILPFLLFLLIPALLGYRYGTALAKRLQAGQPLDHHKNWRLSARTHHLGQVGTFLSALLYIVSIVVSFSSIL